MTLECYLCAASPAETSAASPRCLKIRGPVTRGPVTRGALSWAALELGWRPCAGTLCLCHARRLPMIFARMLMEAIVG